MQEIFDRNKKYYVDNSHMIAMNGEPDKWTNFMHAFNTFLNFFWADYFGGGFWTQDQWLENDIRDTTKKFIELVNKPEDEMSIGILTFIQGLKPAPHYRRGRGNYPGLVLMAYYDDETKEYGYHPRVTFGKIMELLKHDSIQEIVRQELKEAGLPYINIINNGN